MLWKIWKIYVTNLSSATSRDRVTPTESQMFYRKIIRAIYETNFSQVVRRKAEWTHLRESDKAANDACRHSSISAFSSKKEWGCFEEEITDISTFAVKRKKCRAIQRNRGSVGHKTIRDHVQITSEDHSHWITRELTVLFIEDCRPFQTVQARTDSEL